MARPYAPRKRRELASFTDIDLPIELVLDEPSFLCFTPPVCSTRSPTPFELILLVCLASLTGRVG